MHRRKLQEVEGAKGQPPRQFNTHHLKVNRPVFRVKIRQFSTCENPRLRDPPPRPCVSGASHPRHTRRSSSIDGRTTEGRTCEATLATQAGYTQGHPEGVGGSAGGSRGQSCPSVYHAGTMLRAFQGCRVGGARAGQRRRPRCTKGRKERPHDAK